MVICPHVGMFYDWQHCRPDRAWAGCSWVGLRPQHRRGTEHTSFGPRFGTRFVIPKATEICGPRLGRMTTTSTPLLTILRALTRPAAVIWPSAGSLETSLLK